MTRTAQHEAEHKVLLMAMELSGTTWKLGFGDGGPKQREKNVPAGAIDVLMTAIEWAKQRFKLPSDVEVHSCYEAGRDGFWLHRELVKRGVHNRVIDPASVEVNRRARRRKTDRIDVGLLLRQLTLDWRGEGSWSVVRVPSEQEEDARRPHRELRRLKKERQGHASRIQALLALHGVQLKVGKKLPTELAHVRRNDGSELPPSLREELLREAERLAVVDKQLAAVEKEQLRQSLSRGDVVGAKLEALLRLRGIGQVGATVLVYELFGWRVFSNPRQLGSLVGLAPTPFQSGGMSREQGISKSGLGPVRALLVELAWQWLRHQPGSDISRWFKKKFAHGNGRQRRIGIVALARRLLVALWRYVEQEQLPKGALLKPGC